MTNLSKSDFTKIIVRKLNTIPDVDVILKNPNGTSKFPCISITSPLDFSLEINDAIVIRKQFSVSIECWGTDKYVIMNLADEIEEKLRELNILKSGNIPDQVDGKIRKHRLGGIYEVIYNSLTDSFQCIK